MYAMKTKAIKSTRKTSLVSRMRHEFHELARFDPTLSLNVTELVAIRLSLPELAQPGQFAEMKPRKELHAFGAAKFVSNR